MTNKFLIVLTAFMVFIITFRTPESVKASSIQQDIPFDQPTDEWESRQYGYCQNINLTRPCNSWDKENEFSPMLSSLIEEIANQTNLTADEIIIKIMDGVSLFEIAFNAGMSSDSFYEIHNNVREQIWQERQSNREIWEYLPFSRRGRMTRIFGQLFISENRNLGERGLGTCHR
jgi:hypothetical protein